MGTKTAEDILYDLNTTTIKSKLIDFYPDKIMDLKGKVRDARDRYKDAEADRAAEEANILAEIADEKDPATSKAKYSNNEARNAELLKRKRANKDYKIAAGVVRDAEQVLNRAEDELEACQNKFKATMFVAQILAAEVDLYAGKQVRVFDDPKSVINNEPAKEPY
jgi:hypothetical protein